jgi:hypothetical protein
VTSPWLALPPPDPRVLTLPELLALWKANRSGVKGANTTLGSVVAEEVCKRLIERQEWQS